MAKQPMQPLVVDERGTVRFQENAIVRWLLDANGKIDMNTIACTPFSQEDRQQFAQLIGYSLAGYHELSYVSDKSAAEASRRAKEAAPNQHQVGCREVGCRIHCGVEEEP